MASQFPSNPSNGDTVQLYGRTYEYSSLKNAWHPVATAPKLGELMEVDVTGISAGDGIVYEGVDRGFVPGYGAISRVVATVNDLPLTYNNYGELTFVSSNNRLYMWRGNAWTSIALINTSPTITVGPNQSYTLATDGTPTVITLEAQDPEEVPVTWSYSVTSGSIGTAATVDQSGSTFTVTPSTSDPGNFELTFTASDGINIGTASSTFDLSFALQNGQIASKINSKGRPAFYSFLNPSQTNAVNGGSATTIGGTGTFSSSYGGSSNVALIRYFSGSNKKPAGNQGAFNYPTDVYGFHYNMPIQSYLQHGLPTAQWSGGANIGTYWDTWYGVGTAYSAVAAQFFIRDSGYASNYQANNSPTRNGLSFSFNSAANWRLSAGVWFASNFDCVFFIPDDVGQAVTSTSTGRLYKTMLGSDTWVDCTDDFIAW